MKQKNNNPRNLCGASGDCIDVADKVMQCTANVMILPRVQRKVYELLRSGGKHSVFDITTRLHLADPRGHIAALRRKGIEIHDEWISTTEGARYKVYFINAEKLHYDR